MRGVNYLLTAHALTNATPFYDTPSSAYHKPATICKCGRKCKQISDVCQRCKKKKRK